MPRRSYQRHPRVSLRIERVAGQEAYNVPGGLKMKGARKAYRACAWIPLPTSKRGLSYQRGHRRPYTENMACAWGKSPRVAAGKALARLGGAIVKRRGLKFKGLSER